MNTESELVALPKTGRMCIRQSCNNPGALIPRIRVWAEGDRRETSSANFEVADGYHCMKCMKTAELNDVFPPENQEMVTKQFIKEGKRAPDWSSARIVWESLH